MNNYDIEMCYGFGITLNIQAENKKEAIEKAKEIVSNDITVLDMGGDIENVGDIEFEQVNFIQESEDK